VLSYVKICLHKRFSASIIIGIQNKKMREIRMEFFKIGEHAVCCFITAAELEERDIHTGDFIKNTSKLQEFLQSLIDEASEEVAFEIEEERLAVQVMPLPGKDLFIAFSETPMRNIVEMMDYIEKIKQERENYFQETPLPRPREREEIYESPKLAKPVEKRDRNLKLYRWGWALYCFDNLEDVERFCELIVFKDTIPSALYKDPKDNKFYLKIEKGRLSARKFDVICSLASEFAQPQVRNKYRSEYIREHLECIIPKWAIRIMKNL
jgi:adapter protein MecA 1/2